MTETTMGRVVAVCVAKGHHFSKSLSQNIRLLAGLGVEGDAHMGAKVQHLSRVRKNPDAPNLRQVHLIHTELFDEIRTKGFDVKPGDLGENVTTEGIDLLGLSAGTRLHLGNEAVIEITGLRNPCYQIDDFRKGLLKATLDKDADGKLVRKTGIMSIVLAGGDVRPGDSIRVEPPQGPHRSLQVV
jgi:MOSC domain-containing protein YiiM